MFGRFGDELISSSLAVVICMEVRGRAVMYTHGKPFLTIMLSKIQVLIWGGVISFKTNATFVMDPGITDPRVQMFGSVVSTVPGPIAVWDVQIVG